MPCMQLEDQLHDNLNCKQLLLYHMAAFGAIQELIWLKGVLSEIGIHLVDPITLHVDAKSAIALAKNPMHHKRSKYIDI